MLRELAEDYTVVFLVDELDRCLPEYAIKVLERLHHLTEGNPNIVTIIAIDKDQLMSSIKQIFGFGKPEKYLEKFFNFELKLDCGTVSEQVSEKYADYFKLFDKELFPFDDSVEEFLRALFKDIDIRTQEQLLKKAMLVHKLLYKEKKDYSFMCMELLLAVMICVYNDESCFSEESVDITSMDRVFIFSRNAPQPAFAAFFAERFDHHVSLKREHSFPGEAVSYILTGKANLYGAVLFRHNSPPERCRCQNRQQYAGPLRCRLHPPNLHPRHPAGSESGSRNHGKLYGPGHVTKNKIQNTR